MSNLTIHDFTVTHLIRIAPDVITVFQWLVAAILILAIAHILRK